MTKEDKMTKHYRKLVGEDLYFTEASHHHPANTYFHFSFANYHNPNNMQFGVLRVLNDDDVRPNSGFDRHPHKDMEIISYIVKGELTHWDSVTNSEETLGRGTVQTLTAGSGLWHSELNKHNGWTRFLQIWILPPARGLPVRYDHQEYSLKERQNKLLHIVGNTSNKNEVPLHLNQDINMFVSEFTDEGAKVQFRLEEGRQAYVNNIEWRIEVEGLAILKERDSLEVVGPATLDFKYAGENAHFIIIEMAETVEP